jgi:hypothetical protein
MEISAQEVVGVGSYPDVAVYRSAFGLSLESTFPLPGLPASEGELPRLRLDLVDEGELQGRWSGPVSSSAWRGRLRDGAELTIAWGRAGDLLFGYGTEALYLLDPAGREMVCAPAEASALGWQRVLLSRVLPVVAIARGYEALHAAAVETPAGVVAVVGPSGAGKSTLAAELLRRGHRLFGDDVLVIGSGAEGVLAYPAGPHLSLERGGEGGLDVEVLGELGGKLWAVSGKAACAPAPVAAVVLLERSEGPVAVQELPPSPLAAAPFMLGLPDEEGRDASRFALYADLVESARLLRLGGDGAAPELAAALERAVAEPATVGVGTGR